MTRTPLLERLLHVAAGSFLGFIAFLVGSASGTLSLSGDLTVGNIMQAGTTLLVAFLVTHYLQRQTASDRKEKELLLRHYEYAIVALEQFDRSGRTMALVDANAALKKLSSNCRAVSDLLKELKYSHELAQHTGTDDLIQAVRRLTTETPIATDDRDPDSPIAIKEGIVILSTDRAALVDIKVHQLRMRLLRAQIALNRA